MAVAPGSPPPRAAVDPRSIITEDAFRLDPVLLGKPLARPWRRAAAMAMDGVLVAILANAPSVLFGLAAALVLFRASAGSAEAGVMRRGVRLLFRLGMAVVLFAVAVSLWGRVTDTLSGDDEPAVASARARDGVPAPPAPGVLTGIGGLAAAADVIALTRTDDEAEWRARAGRVVDLLRDQGIPEAEIREVLEEVGGGPDRPWMAAATDSLLAEAVEAEEAERLSGDSLALALAGALEEGDSVRAAGLRERLSLSLAADTLARLGAGLREARRDLDRVEDERDELRAEAEEGVGIMRVLRSFADDLGLGFGWTGLYFTASLALWKGATPGKRLMRIRVIRLDGRPIGWWAAFERFGGYAASIATGLLGFFQILWDRNRQGIHDKISETVVVQE